MEQTRFSIRQRASVQDSDQAALGKGKPLFLPLAGIRSGETPKDRCSGSQRCPLPPLKELALGPQPQLCFTSLSWREERETGENGRLERREAMQIEGSEVQGIFTRLPPVRGLWVSLRPSERLRS